MKVRNDFVANSSSSSYIIAFKNDCGFDEETMKKYPFLSVWPSVISKVLSYNDKWCDTEEADIYNCIEDYESKLDEKWSYDWSSGRYRTLDKILKNNEWLRDDYKLISEYLLNGYSVAEKSVSYHDDFLRDEIAVLSRDNPNFIVLKCDD